MIELTKSIFVVLDIEDVKYLLSHLDEEPQDSKAYEIREKLYEQSASRIYNLREEEINHPITEIEK
jgi:hypothetical protein